MVRILYEEAQLDNVNYIEAAGLSDDDKPTGNLANGSTYLCVDTGDVYFYDEENAQWCKAGGDDA